MKRTRTARLQISPGMLVSSETVIVVLKGGGVASQPKTFCRLAFPPPVYLFLVHAPEDCTVTDYCFGTWNLEDGGQGWLKKKKRRGQSSAFWAKKQTIFPYIFLLLHLFCTFHFSGPGSSGPMGGPRGLQTMLWPVGVPLPGRGILHVFKSRIFFKKNGWVWKHR